MSSNCVQAVLGWVPISEVSAPCLYVSSGAGMLAFRPLKDRLVEKVSDVIQTKEVVMARVVQDLGNVSFSLRPAE